MRLLFQLLSDNVNRTLRNLSVNLQKIKVQGEFKKANLLTEVYTKSH